MASNQERRFTPFWAWGWGSASIAERIYYIYRVTVRPLLGVAAIVGALVVVVDAYPRTMNTVFWRSHEYEVLSRIHAGYDISFAEQLLGVPTQSRSVDSTQYEEKIYVRRDHFVQLVADDSGRIVLFSVTSCSPDFQPEFVISPDLVAVLQKTSLAKTPETRAKDATGPDDRWLFAEDSRQLGYQPGETGSTPQMYWESTGSGSTASLNRTWFVGVNPLCVGADQYDDLGNDHYFGEVAEAPESVLAFRQHFAANNYAEVVDLQPAIDDLGMILLPPKGSSDFECLDDETQSRSDVRCGAVTVGTFWFELAIFPDGDTRVTS